MTSSADSDNIASLVFATSPGWKVTLQLVVVCSGGNVDLDQYTLPVRVLDVTIQRELHVTSMTFNQSICWVTIRAMKSQTISNSNYSNKIVLCYWMVKASCTMIIESPWRFAYYPSTNSVVCLSAEKWRRGFLWSPVDSESQWMMSVSDDVIGRLR